MLDGGSLSGTGGVGTGNGVTPAIQGPIASSVPITAATWANTAGGTATITAANSFTVGQTVLVSGVLPSGYDGTYKILGATAANFTYALTTNPGTATTFGAAVVIATVNPGDNGAASAPAPCKPTATSPGLRPAGSGSISSIRATPIPTLSGADYDTLYVNGNVNLGSGNAGALLTGSYGVQHPDRR